MFADGKTYFSPAKVNLFLRITGRRENGFHEIYSLVQVLSLFDTLNFKVSERDFFSCSDPNLPMDDSNLVVKAVDLFRKKSSFKQGITLHLKKEIPTEAGLGGGSGNAATTLFALNVLSGNLFRESELAEMGAELGSDIPVFFSSGTALMSGRGEIIEDRPDLFTKQFYSLFKPSFGLPTREVYQKFRESGKIFALKHPIKVKDHLYMNDLENPAYLLKPELLWIKRELLESGFNQVVMSGSGSAFFCLGEGNPTAFDGFKMVFIEPVRRKKGEWFLPPHN